MKKFGTMIAVLIIFLMPFVALKAKRDAELEMRCPNVEVIRSESVAKPGDALNARKKAAKAPEPALTVQEQIASLNAGYKQMWESEAQSKEPRYKLTEDERQEIERIVASEGGCCPYEFQALVAQCFLNICELDDLRPLEVLERGDFWLVYDVEPSETTKQAVSDVFDKGIFPTDEPIRAYYNPKYCSSPWHESQCYVLTCCDCRFFKGR